MPAPPPDAMPPNPGAGGGQGPTRLRLRVLVADDNRDAADSWAVLLGVLGADVVVRYDGLSALAAADPVPDVGLFDVDMPGLNGCELAERVRAAAADRPLLLVAITGINDSDAVNRTTAAGFDLHLAKPADPAGLVARLTEFGRRRNIV